MGIDDWGGSSPDTLASPPLGGPGGWAEAVAGELHDLADAITAHEADPDPHPVYATDSDLTAHAAAANPHPGAMRVLHPLTDDCHVQQWDAGKNRWQTVHYDSGWRDVSAGRTNWTAGELHMRRVGGRVFFRAMNLAGVTEFQPCYTIPTEWKVAYGYEAASAIGRENQSTGKPVWGIASGTTVLLFGGFVDGSAWSSASYKTTMSFTWACQDALPTSLPGVLLSPAPA